MNTAIVAAQNALTIAAQCLGRRQPTSDDVENAINSAKEALDLLKASAALMKQGIYSVGEEPTATGPLFEGEQEGAPQ